MELVCPSDCALTNKALEAIRAKAEEDTARSHRPPICTAGFSLPSNASRTSPRTFGSRILFAMHRDFTISLEESGP